MVPTTPSSVSSTPQTNPLLQPRKKRPAQPPSPPPPPTLPSPSPLAIKNNLSASTEAEIRAAFVIFSNSTPTAIQPPNAGPGPGATIPTGSLSRALDALDCGPRTTAEKSQLMDSVDPTGVGEVRYEDFLALAALQLGRRRGNRRREEEVESAFRLFLDNAGEGEGEGRKERISIRDLRRVARELGSEGGGGGGRGGMGEDVLRNMIMEANGLGPEGVERGVGREEFADVMRRAGVF